MTDQNTSWYSPPQIASVIITKAKLVSMTQLWFWLWGYWDPFVGRKVGTKRGTHLGIERHAGANKLLFGEAKAGRRQGHRDTHKNIERHMSANNWHGDTHKNIEGHTGANNWHRDTRIRMERHMDANRLLFCESKADKKGLAAVPVMRWKDTAAFWWYAEVVGVIGVGVGVTGLDKL